MVICALFLSCLPAIGLYVGHICLPVMGYGKLLWFPEGPHMAWQTLPVGGLGFRLFFSIKEKQGCNSNQRQVAKTQKLVQMGFISNILKRPKQVKSGAFSHSFSLFVSYSFIYLFLSKFTSCPLNICLKLRKQFIMEETDSYTAFKKEREKKSTYSFTSRLDTSVSN